MGKVKITHARSNENGGITGGQLGDNNQKEISTTDFYIHNKGWNIIRPKNASTADKIADTALLIAANDAFGYDQEKRNTGINEAKKVNYVISNVKTKCALDCSTTVRLSCICAGVDPGDIYTGNELQKLLATGQFDQVEFVDESMLLRGDILVTKTKGHTAIVTTAPQQARNNMALNGWGSDKVHYYKDGKMLKGEWLHDTDGYWYYFSSANGVKLTGWRKLYDKNNKLRDCYFGSDGKVWWGCKDNCGYMEPYCDK